MEISVIRKRFENSEFGNLSGDAILTLSNRVGVSPDSTAASWAAILLPFWGSVLTRYSTADSAADLASWCACAGLSTSRAMTMSLSDLGNALPSFHEADIGVIFGALKNSRRNPAPPAAAQLFFGSPPLDDITNATAPPPLKMFKRGIESRIAAAGTYAVATAERNVHGAFGLAGGASLLMLWKALQDETNAAATLAKSNGIGQDVYLGVLAAAVPLMAGAVALSMALAVTTQVVAVTDVTAARYFSLPSLARYSDVVTFVISALSAATSQAFLLSDTPQGEWVTWIFVGCAAFAFFALAPTIGFFIWTMRKPFSSFEHKELVGWRKEQFNRILSAAGVSRRIKASNEFAKCVRLSAAGLAHETPVFNYPIQHVFPVP